MGIQGNIELDARTGGMGDGFMVVFFSDKNLKT
jgi:hypothetical protein